MDDDDWDLHAVVRGRSATVNTTTEITKDAFLSSPTLPTQNNENSFHDFPCFFDDKNESFIGLHEIYRDFCVDPPPETTISTVPSPVAQVLRPRDGIAHIQSLPQMNMQKQEIVQPMSFPATVSQPVRQRRRKNQQMKMVREMTQEEMAGDLWSWRKYGQKPIKGSPFPRNYYRCSTSKGCVARKQVERSANDPEIFVVAYTGEHTHPRPIHRSLLAGSTRNRLGQNKSNYNNNATLSLPTTDSHTLYASCSSFSSTIPAIEGQSTGQQNEDIDMMEEGDNEVENEEDDSNIMMINDLMNDDEVIFKWFQDFDQSSDQPLSPW